MPSLAIAGPEEKPNRPLKNYFARLCGIEIKLGLLIYNP
jgi:hypothetical protein